MRRSARISARRDFSSSTTQNKEGVESKQLAVVDLSIQKKPKGKAQPKGKTPTATRTVRRSSRKNILVEDVENEEKSSGCQSPAVDPSTETKNEEEDSSKQFNNTRNENPDEEADDGEISCRVSDSEVRRGDDDHPCSNDGRKEVQLTRTKRRKTIGKNKAEAEGNTSMLPTQVTDHSLHNVDVGAKSAIDSGGFLVISTEEIETENVTKDIDKDDIVTENVTKDDIVTENGSCSEEVSFKEENERLHWSGPNTEDKGHGNELIASENSLESGDGSQNHCHRLSTLSQLSTKHNIGKQKTYPKFKSIDKLSLDKLLAKNSGKSDLLNLTSEVFQKIPFKITKETIAAQKGVNVELKFTKINNKNPKPDGDILQQDILSLTVDENNPDKMVKAEHTLSSELDPRITSSDLYFKVDRKGTVPTSGNFKMNQKEERKILKRSVIKSNFEQKQRSVVHKSDAKERKKREHKAKETAGQGWYNLPKTEMTDEVKRDLQVIKMRNVLDPKRFYKKGDKKISEYFQVGTVVAGAAEFYSSRLPKKDRKRTMVDQLLADAEFRSRNKKKYLEIQEQRRNNGKKFHKKRHRRKEKRGRT